ncbi:acetolactate synthase 2 small subunit [Pseudoalteromonas sp. MMG010]|uniref:acetolactate synthase 2 small subunit n=1 Tax=Pseudoalteromonas sp. MMG010 TaxID=2822685 RepID=UPI001B3A4EF8|nr:acetolactate synthase 2 small subunit [Pseudoalteromonas sp. MMG010]MBQ4834203.1 acetolactate synthase 2 small subunit [Pseudoalteromonas sp. MMG010]
MKHNLTIALKSQSIAIERFLRVVRHRGFELHNLQLTMVNDQYHVEMSVDSDKPIYLLTTQLSKLIDVKDVIVNDKQHTAVAI